MDVSGEMEAEGVEEGEGRMKRAIEGGPSDSDVEEDELQRSRRRSSIQAASEFDSCGHGDLVEGEGLDLVEGEEAFDLRQEGGGRRREERRGEDRQFPWIFWGSREG